MIRDRQADDVFIGLDLLYNAVEKLLLNHE
jgi:hypothetical protein